MAEGNQLTVELLRDELKLSREAILGDLKNEISILRAELSQEIEAIRSETTTSLQTLRHEVGDELSNLRQGHAQVSAEQASMTHGLTDAIDRIQQLEQANELKTKELKQLKDKCFDLESRSRRQNLRFIGIPEGAEGSSPTKFMSELIPELLGAENFPTPVTIDRAHRSLAPKPKKGDRPRPIIVRLHYYTQKERIMGIARGKSSLNYQGSPVHIYPDLPTEISKMRATFGAVKAKLREAKVEYSLFYPAVLSVNFNGVRHTFNTPQAAEDFYKAKIAPPQTG